MSDDDNADFFGGDDDDDALPEQEMQALGAQFRNVGFLEAFEESKEEKLQKGFEDGYKQGFDVSVRIGALLAEAALLSDSNENVIARIREFLESMGTSTKKPCVSREELEELEKEVKCGGKNTLEAATS